MIEVICNTKEYFNQYYDVTDLPQTVKNEKNRTCNVTCVAMITGDHPDSVLTDMFVKHGINDKFQWEKNLVDYLRDRGFACKEMTLHAYPKARNVTDRELEKMMGEIVKGKVILYHKKGHYQLMVGYRIVDGGIPEFIFNDPAGDRNKFKYLRKRLSGFRVAYSKKKVQKEKIYGSCWSVEI